MGRPSAPASPSATSSTRSTASPPATASGAARGMASQQIAGMLPQVGVYLVTLFLFAPLLLHLALVFPKPRPIVVDRPELLRWIYGPPALSLAAIGAMTLVLWGTSMHAAWVMYAIAGLAIAVVAGAAVRLALRVRRERRDALVREPLAVQIVAIGMLACSAYLASHFVNSFVLGIIISGVAILVIFAGILFYPVATVVALYRTYRESG